MREIKFRAWLWNEKEMSEVLVLDNQEEKVFVVRKDGAAGWRMFAEVELMQYTGLKDSHGNEVYEGDIIEAVFELLDDELKTVMDAGVVVFKDYGFQVQTFEDHYEPLHEWAQLSEELKVIGNIYEK